jgi:hypothetical protein
VSDNDDLAHLNYAELLEERTAVKARIREIVAERAVTGRPDDARYRRWLRGINFEQHQMADRLDQIKLHLARGQQLLAAKKTPSGETLPPHQLADLEERRAKLRADLAAAGPDALLLRVRRLLAHILGGVPFEELPLDDDDRETLRSVSVYLRARYGTTPTKEFVHGEGV